MLNFPLLLRQLSPSCCSPVLVVLFDVPSTSLAVFGSARPKTNLTTLVHEADWLAVNRWTWLSVVTVIFSAVHKTNAPKTANGQKLLWLFFSNKSSLLRFQQSNFSSKVRQNRPLPAAGYIRIFLIFCLDVPPVFGEGRRRLRVQERPLWRGEEWAARLPLLGGLPGQGRLLHQLQDFVQRLATPHASHTYVCVPGS